MSRLPLPLLSVGMTFFFVLQFVHADDQLPTVPEGFTIEKVADSSLVKFPMMAGFDDKGRLFVAASSGLNKRANDLMEDPPNFVKLLEDTDNDGTFDKSTTFADKMTLPMGALWYRGALYVASPPNIWRLEDTDGDGVADKRDIIVDTFGFNGNAASVHGCFLGPNGRIYWCDGRHGHEFRDKNGNLVSQGKAARIFSCRPDGSDVQAWCGGGMDNPVEIDFTETGEMIGSVNILFGRPRVDCLVHWMDGGVYPRYDQEDCIAEFPRTGDLLQPMTRMGHVAVSGMTVTRSDQFGSEFQGNIFTTQFNTHKVVRSVLKREGGTFRTEEEDFLVSNNIDFHPTDVFEDADGSLLVIDTGGWFRIGCPVSEVSKPDIHGAIYRIRRDGAHHIDDPRGLKLGLANKPPEELVRFLDDHRPAVRTQAIDVLALRGDQAIRNLRPATNLNVPAPVTVDARRNAVWALSRMETIAANGAIHEALLDRDESVRLAAARSLGTLRDTQAIELLADLMDKDTPAVQREAATAIGRILELGKSTDSEIEHATYALLRPFETGNIDRVFEHALIYALIRGQDAEKELVKSLENRNPRIRRAALIALDQSKSDLLTREAAASLLDTDDQELQEEAIAVMSRRKGWTGETLQLLKGWLHAGDVSRERGVTARGFLLAQAADPEVQALVAVALGDAKLSASNKQLLLEVVHRATLKPVPDSWLDAIEINLSHDNPSVSLQALHVVRGLDSDRYDQTLRQIVEENSQPRRNRLAALSALAPRLKPISKVQYDLVLKAVMDDALDAVDRMEAARALSEATLPDDMLLELASELPNADPLTVGSLLEAFSRSEGERVGKAFVKALGESGAAENISPEQLARIVRKFPERIRLEAAQLVKRDGNELEQQRLLLDRYIELSTGGDAARGREIFLSKKVACAGCHTVKNVGGKVGPDLSTIGRIRNGADLLESLLFPSATFAREFRSYLVATNEGRIHTGVISRRTADSLYLRTAKLEEIRIARDEIDIIRESDTSIMPKGLEKRMTDAEFRDLLAYLQSLR